MAAGPPILGVAPVNLAHATAPEAECALGSKLLADTIRRQQVDELGPYARDSRTEPRSPP